MSDTLLGSILLAAFLVLVFAAGWVLYRIKNAMLAREWEPLRPFVEHATVAGDGGGAATSWLTGTYRGHRITAAISPDVSKYTGSDGGHYRNAFSVALDDVPGAFDWRLEHRPGSSGEPWHAVAQDETLRHALAVSGATSILARLGAGDVDYSRSTRSLRFSEDVRPSKVQSPERFRATLDALVDLAGVNAVVNAASDRGRA